jgi:predicted Zn-dependent protease
LWSVRTAGSKFVEAPRPEFYDLKTDAGELDNKYEPWNEQVEKFRGMLAKLRATAPLPEPTKGVVGQGTIDELKVLGYLSRVDAGSSTNVPEPWLLPDPKDRIEQQNLLHFAMMSSEDDHEVEARKALERVLEMDPDSAAALQQLGELELRAREYSKAAENLKRASKMRPDDTTAAFYEGQALEKMHDFTGARDALESSLKQLPGQLRARLLLGQIYLELKNPESAEDQFEAAILFQANSVEAQLGLAHARIAQDNFAEALRGLEQLSRSQPRNAAVFELLAQAYSGLGKKLQAQQAEERAKRLRQEVSK